MSPDAVFQALQAVVESRRTANPEQSYVASLLRKGDDAILKKVGEEATETLIAGKNADPGPLVHEVADLWFHLVVLLVHKGLSVQDVSEELARRFGISGHAEKAARPQQE